MTAPLFAGIGGHHKPRPGRTDSWITPKAIIDALGGADSFDLDPCACTPQPWPCARASFTIGDNGLKQRWWGRVWMNPPYSTVLLARFMARLAEHGTGTALIFARTDTDAFHRYGFERASAALYLRGRICFHRPDGSLILRPSGAAANAGGPSVLLAYGARDMDALAASGLEGHFEAWRLPRGFLIAALDPTWHDVVAQALTLASGPVRLDELYRAIATHPKTRRNPHWRAKVRQTLQQGRFHREARGVWAASA